jgi:hypothetical protein
MTTDAKTLQQSGNIRGRKIAMRRAIPTTIKYFLTAMETAMVTDGNILLENCRGHERFFESDSSSMISFGRAKGKDLQFN